MLLGGAGEIGPAADRHRAAPDDVLAALHRAGEHLVLQIAVIELGVFGEPQHLARFGERASERLFAGDADELRPAGFHQPMDLAHGVEPGEIRHADPDRVDLAGNQHGFERSEGPAGPELERVGLGRQRLAIGGGGAVDAGDADMANGNERLQVEIVDEAGADQTDPQRGDRCVTVHAGLSRLAEL